MPDDKNFFAALFDFSFQQQLTRRLVEVGTHDELMAKSGPYPELYSIQAAAYY